MAGRSVRTEAYQRSAWPRLRSSPGAMAGRSPIKLGVSLAPVVVAILARRDGRAQPVVGLPGRAQPGPHAIMLGPATRLRSSPGAMAGRSPGLDESQYVTGP